MHPPSHNILPEAPAGVWSTQSILDGISVFCGTFPTMITLLSGNSFAACNISASPFRSLQPDATPSKTFWLCSIPSCLRNSVVS